MNAGGALLHADIEGVARDYPAGYRIPPHSHDRAQLVYAAAGVMRITTASGTWITPPQRAVWVPARESHQIAMVGRVAMRTLYLQPRMVPAMPRHCAIVEVKPLLRELILAMIEMDEDVRSGRSDPPDPGEPAAAGRRRRLLAALLQEELRTLPVVPLRIPVAADPRLVRLCDAILEDPADSQSLESWGDRVGASSRTLARLCRRELGMSFAAWRQQVRLAEALARIAGGAPVGAAAAAAGYDSASAFSAMFRRVLGTTPSRYLRLIAPPGTGSMADAGQ